MSMDMAERPAASASSSIVTRAAGVLDTVCASSVPLRYSEVVALTGLPKSSAHRVLSILLGEGLLAFDPRRQTYAPGPRLIGWAASALRAGNLPELATPALEALVESTGAHAALSVLDGTSVLYLKTVEAGRPFRLAPRVGERSPAHACAAGKVLVAHLPQGPREAVLGALTYEQCSERTILSREAFEATLDSVRADGLATCDREEFLQVVGIAAPVFNANGDAVAAVSLWNSVDRHDFDALLDHRDALQKAAAAISKRLGHGCAP